MDTRGSGTGFSLILDQFRYLMLRTFWALRLVFSIYVGLVYRVLVVPIVASKLGRLGLLDPGSRMEGIAKHFVHRKRFVWISVFFDVRWRLWEQLF